MSSPVWFITGVSNGLGLMLCLRVLRAKHTVVGTVRSRTKAADAVRQIESAGGRVIELDLNESKKSITKKVQAAGPIDYLVNNAGFFVLGAIEQVSEQEAHSQLQTNFFGPLHVLQAALPSMRAARRGGAVVNVSSVAARDPRPSSGVYAASKAALEAVSDALAAEVAPFGLAVLVVEPGAFRTNFFGAYAPPEVPVDPDYEGTPFAAARDAFVAAREATYAGSAAQPGDPAKGVDRIFEAVTGEGLAGNLKGKVARLVLGPDAYERIQKSNERLLADLALGKEVAHSTNF
ncbi:NAD(P)-binding protein [Hypoxylon sp. FL1284]|nr:NAD(P)-binding protein [Hypoxylon sp. FL1284]